MSLSSVIPQFLFYLLLTTFLFLYLKYFHLATLLQRLIHWLPLETLLNMPEPVLNSLELERIDDTGLILLINVTLPASRLPLSYLCIKARILSLYITELDSSQKVVRIDLNKQIVVHSEDDIQLVQKVRVDVGDVQGLKALIKRVCLVGEGELKRISLKIACNLSFSINDIFIMERIPLWKIIPLGQVIKILEDKSKRQLNDNTQKVSANDTLFPDADICPFAHPGLRGVEAGLNITFSKPPQLAFQLGKIKCRILLNDSTVAQAIISGLTLSNTSLIFKPVVEVHMAALSSKPITGALTTLKGVMKGVLIGAANGILYKDWGANAAILGIKEISIENQDGTTIWWLEELLEGIEVDHDLDAARKFRNTVDQRAKNLQEGLDMMLADIFKEASLPI